MSQRYSGSINHAKCFFKKFWQEFWQEELDKFIESLREIGTNIQDRDQDGMDGLIDDATKSHRKAKTRTKRGY